MLRFPFYENLLDGWTSFSPVFSKLFWILHVTTASPRSARQKLPALRPARRAGGAAHPVGTQWKFGSTHQQVAWTMGGFSQRGANGDMQSVD